MSGCYRLVAPQVVELKAELKAQHGESQRALGALQAENHMLQHQVCDGSVGYECKFSLTSTNVCQTNGLRLGYAGQLICSPKGPRPLVLWSNLSMMMHGVASLE